MPIVTLSAGSLDGELSRLARDAEHGDAPRLWLVNGPRSNIKPILDAAERSAQRDGRLVIRMNMTKTSSRVTEEVTRTAYRMHQTIAVACGDRACGSYSPTFDVAVTRLVRHMGGSQAPMIIVDGMAHGGWRDRLDFAKELDASAAHNNAIAVIAVTDEWIADARWPYDSRFGPAALQIG